MGAGAPRKEWDRRLDQEKGAERAEKEKTRQEKGKGCSHKDVFVPIPSSLEDRSSTQKSNGCVALWKREKRGVERFLASRSRAGRETTQKRIGNGGVCGIKEDFATPPFSFTKCSVMAAFFMRGKKRT